MMTWDHLDSDLCQHVITFINTALDSPDGPHKGHAKCLALRQRLVTALLDQGLMRGITDLQDLVQESLFQVGFCCVLLHSFIHVPVHVLAHPHINSSSCRVPVLAVLLGVRLYGQQSNSVNCFIVSASKGSAVCTACSAVSMLLKHMASLVTVVALLSTLLNCS